MDITILLLLTLNVGSLIWCAIESSSNTLQSNGVKVGEEALGFGIITYSVRFPALLESIVSETKEIILYKIYISEKNKLFTLLF